jgi:hypothetical protein
MNPNLREILKEELQKLLNAGFIYPISDSEWVSPLVIVPKKNRKWRVCIDYRALNKATQKDHFLLPFIDQVLDMVSVGITRSKLHPKTKIRPLLLAPRELLLIESSHLDYVMHQQPFKEQL